MLRNESFNILVELEMFRLDNEPLYIFVIVISLLPVTFLTILAEKYMDIAVTLTASTTDTLELT